MAEACHPGFVEREVCGTSTCDSRKRSAFSEHTSVFDSFLRRHSALLIGSSLFFSTLSVVAQSQKAPARRIAANLDDAAGPLDRTFDFSAN
jgi:hypothetical protein